MTKYKGIMALVVETAKKKGVRFDVSDFPDGEIKCLNQHVVIFRGSAGKLIDRLFQSDVGRLARKKRRKLLSDSRRSVARDRLQKRSIHCSPNVQSSATRDQKA